jgi:hypothetical protein
MTRPSHAILLKSFSGNAWYRVSVSDRVCDCPCFRSMPGPPCKHLKALGVYNEHRSFTPTERPTFSQALSALVKSIRLRRSDDAVYWLIYLDAFKERTSRIRMARRLLIGAAEDGHSISVMESTASKFSYLSQAKTDVFHLAAEVLRICKTPNWWHPDSGGSAYIRSGLLAERLLLHYPGLHSEENMTQLIGTGISEGDPVSAIAGVMGLSHARITGTRQAQLLSVIAKKHDHILASRLAAIHLSARSALSSDNNFLCQAAWMMAGGSSPIALQEQAVYATEVIESTERARKRWKEPLPIPRWCCDGLHSAGDDPRFMGVWFHMYAACLAFEHYGRLDPQDTWLPEFNCYDGLTIASTLPLSSTESPAAVSTG